MLFPVFSFYSKYRIVLTQCTKVNQTPNAQTILYWHSSLDIFNIHITHTDWYQYNISRYAQTIRRLIQVLTLYLFHEKQQNSLTATHAR